MSLLLYGYGQISLSVSLIRSLQTKPKKQVLIVDSEVDDATRGCWQSSKTSETGILNLANVFHCGMNLPYFSFLQLVCVFSCLQLLPFSIVLQVYKFLLQQHFSVLCFLLLQSFCVTQHVSSVHFPRSDIAVLKRQTWPESFNEPLRSQICDPGCWGTTVSQSIRPTCRYRWTG